MKHILLVFLTLLSLWPLPAHAQSTPACTSQDDGSIVCTMGDGSGGGEGGSDGSGGSNNNTCDPATVHYGYQVIAYDASTNTCTVASGFFSCDGVMVEGGEITEGLPCSSRTPAGNPCDTFSVSAGGITCGITEWKVSARVAFPEIYLDVRPFPATLVRWPTALRNGGEPDASGSGSMNYIAYGGGSPNHPRAGDWQDLRLTLTLRQAGPMFVSLPHVGNLILPDQGTSGNPTPIQWQVPSHPSVGGDVLAGSVGSLDELPADMPLFTGNGRAPYKLFWELHYYEYDAIKDCVPGPNSNGIYNCGGSTGHKEVTGYEWKAQSKGGEIPPSAVQNLPSSVMADINNDGTPDAYWDNNLTLRRMDDNNRVDNPRYQRSWNWNGTIYWAVREGQGQIGWP